MIWRQRNDRNRAECQAYRWEGGGGGGGGTPGPSLQAWPCAVIQSSLPVLLISETGVRVRWRRMAPATRSASRVGPVVAVVWTTPWVSEFRSRVRVEVAVFGSPS